MTQSMQRIGVMGGTFDPIHNGHLVAASEVAEKFDLDLVIFVPSGNPWHKRASASAEDRYLMSVIATAANPMFAVSRVDIDRDGTTYTIDTLSELHKQYPEAKLFFITGADALADLSSWKDTAHLMELAHFVGVSRPGHTLAISEFSPDDVSLLEIPALAISSTDCRKRVSEGMPIWYLVPDGVVQYIAKNNLYRSSS